MNTLKMLILIINQTVELYIEFHRYILRLATIVAYNVLINPFKRSIFLIFVHIIVFPLLFVSLPCALCSGEEALPPNLAEQQETPGMSVITNTRPVLNRLGNIRTMGITGYPVETISAVISRDPGPGFNYNSSAPWSAYHDTPTGAIFSAEYKLSLLKIFAKRYPVFVAGFCEARDHSLSSCSGDTSELFDEALALIGNQNASEQALLEQALLEQAFAQSMLSEHTSTSLASLSFEENINASSANISSSSCPFDPASLSGDSSSVASSRLDLASRSGDSSSFRPSANISGDSSLAASSAKISSSLSSFDPASWSPFDPASRSGDSSSVVSASSSSRLDLASRSGDSSSVVSVSSSSRLDLSSRSGYSSLVDLNDSGFLATKGIPAHQNYFIWVSKVLGVELDKDLLSPDLDSEEIARIDKIRALALSDAPLIDVLIYVKGSSLTRGPTPLPPGIDID